MEYSYATSLNTKILKILGIDYFLWILFTRIVVFIILDIFNKLKVIFFNKKLAVQYLNDSMSKLNMSDKQDHFEVLRKIDKDPNSSQRKMAEDLGFSLGKINYCVKLYKQRSY